MPDQSSNAFELNNLSASGRKVLFVDDDKSMLKAIKTELSRCQIDVLLAASGQEGLGIIAQEEGVEVVGSDLGMPEMDGVEFLKQVRDKAPETHRIIFSDEMGQNQVTRALTRGYATHYFIKPWKNRDLKHSVEHILKVRKTLKQRKLLETISEIDKLPSLPAVYQEFIEAVFLEKSIQEIAKIIDKDVSLSTRLLHLANSAFYGGNNIFSVDGAVMRLGLNTVKDMILAFSFVSELDWTSDQLVQLERIFNHSSWVNKYLKTVYEIRHGVPLKQEYASVGVTHDIGKIIALQYFPDRFETIVEKQKKNPDMSFYEAERSGGAPLFMHEEVGAYFLHMWQLPDLLVDTALFHHQPEKAGDQNLDIVEVLAFTNDLVNRLEQMEEDEEFDLEGFEEGFIPKRVLKDLALEIRASIESPAEPVL